MPSLSSFGALRVLAMESCCFMGDGNYHLNHLGSLLQLRYLGLRNMPIDKLPEEIGELQLLQTLDLKGTHLEELPQSVGMLRKLECLDADSVRGIGGMHLGNLTSLEELTVLHAEGFPGFVVELEKMTELRKLCIAVSIGAGPGDIMVKALVKSLGNLQKIQVLHIGGQLWCNATCYDWGGFAPPRQLRDLRLRMDCDMLPVFVNPSLLPNLTSLWMKVVKVKPEDMVILGSFPHLFTLILDGFQACLPDAMADKTEGGGRLFPKLRYLSTNTPLRFHQGAMPSLEYLVFFHISVMWLKSTNQNYVFEFGSLANLPSLRRVGAGINPPGADEVVDALELATNTHPQCPSLELRSYSFRRSD
uniref:Uncharacterized protein n=1 Tax=Avena sativa TaxID=4498 RepID=A0ACD5VF76_AVESA